MKQVEPCSLNVRNRVTRKLGTPEQPESAGTALILQILSRVLLLALYATTIYAY